MNKFDLSFLTPEIKYLAGTDEAGRGPLAGPVVAAAVIFDRNTVIRGVRDSKELTSEEREKLYKRIVARALAYSVCAISHGEIDRINILQASLKAMQLAVKRLKVQPDLILVDGNKTFSYPVPSIPIIDGDAKSFSIGAASIIAKVTRDHIMQRLCQKFPYYLWSKNKGYATPEHIEAILIHGSCCLHRKTFLRKILCPESDLQLDFEIEEPAD
jgi:ribonuclease HII